MIRIALLDPQQIVRHMTIPPTAKQTEPAVGTGKAVRVLRSDCSIKRAVAFSLASGAMACPPRLSPRLNRICCGIYQYLYRPH